jgi:hypothetical protein
MEGDGAADLIAAFLACGEVVFIPNNGEFH